jgi:hypothetical protein
MVIAVMLALCAPLGEDAVEAERPLPRAVAGGGAGEAAEGGRPLGEGRAQPPAGAQTQPPVTVSVDRFDPGPPVPRGFLGLSFEAAALDQISQYATRGDLVAMLRSLGAGVLRFGGVTADEDVAWTDAASPRPAWASSTIGPAQMHALGVLARRSGWRVLLTVGLAHYEPTPAAREVASARRALGPYLAGVEIGNEPNAYGNHGFRELPWIAQGYEEEVTGYREAIEALTPGVPIAGPDVSGSGTFTEWGEEEALAQVPALLTGHHYPLGCAQTPPPSIQSLLSATTRGREALSLTAYMAVSRLRGIPLRIDEANTVSCGGVTGISDTFASALWATGYITQAMTAGATGINLQGNPTNCGGYTPVCAPDAGALAAGRLRAQPEWYALLLTKTLVGDRPLPIAIAPSVAPSPSAPNPVTGPPNPTPGTPNPTPGTPNPTPGTPNPVASAPDLVASAFLEPNHSVRVVLVDDEPLGTPPLALRIALGARMGAATLLPLTAPSPSATGGVLLAGRAVVAAGSWRPPHRAMSAATHAGVLPIELPPDSAMLLTVSRTQAKPRHRRRSARMTRASLPPPAPPHRPQGDTSR